GFEESSAGTLVPGGRTDVPPGGTLLTVSGITVTPAAGDVFDSLSVSLAVGNGVLSLNESAGLAITVDGTAGVLSFNGRPAAIAAALGAGVNYRGVSVGSDTLTVTATASFGGSSASSVATIGLLTTA